MCYKSESQMLKKFILSPDQNHPIIIIGIHIPKAFLLPYTQPHLKDTHTQS